MLILTRKRADSIKIGEDIVVHVMRTGKGSVKIGIEAPAHVRVVRGELNEEAMSAGDSKCLAVAKTGQFTQQTSPEAVPFTPNAGVSENDDEDEIEGDDSVFYENFVGSDMLEMSSLDALLLQH